MYIITKHFLIRSDKDGGRKGTLLPVSQIGKKLKIGYYTRIASGSMRTLKKAISYKMGASDQLSKELEQIC